MILMNSIRKYILVFQHGNFVMDMGLIKFHKSAWLYNSIKQVL